MKNPQVASIIYFLLSTLIIWLFIQEGKTLYFSQNKIILSCGFAGTKQTVQLLAAYFLLNEKKWVFIKRIAFTCFVGSCILIPYSFITSFKLVSNSFLLSIIIAVLVMVILYYKVVKDTGIPVFWFWGQIFCLVTAIGLKLFVIFKNL